MRQEIFPARRTRWSVTRRALMLSAAAVFAVISTSSQGTAQDDVVKIGVLGPITGDAAADGQEMERGVRLAVEEADANGGVAGHTFEVVVGDTEDQSAASVMSAVERVLRKDVDVMLTGYASTSNFEIEMLAERNMPYLVAGQSQQTREMISPNPDKYKTIWSYTPNYDAYETALPPVLNQLEETSDVDFDDRTVALITSDNAYSMSIYEGLKPSFKEAGWEIVVDEKLPFGEISDWRSTLSRIRQADPDVIVNADFLPGNGARFMRQFMENPTDSLVFIQYAPSVPEFLELTKDASTGVIYNMLGAPIATEKNPRALQILEKFKERWGVESGMYGVALYEMTHLYFDALRKVGDPSDHLAIGKAIGETDKQVASGRLVFDQKTHLARQGNDYFPIQFLQIWNGERVLFYPDQFATGEFRMPPWLASSGQ